MTDANTALPAFPPSPANSGASGKPAAGQKSPLDVLEDILNDAKGNAQANQAQDAAAKAEQEAALAEQKQKEDLEKLRQQKKLEDEQKIQQQLASMQQVMASPIQQERAKQDQEKVETLKHQLTADEGFEIVQLDHIKI